MCVLPILETVGWLLVYSMVVYGIVALYYNAISCATPIESTNYTCTSNGNVIEVCNEFAGTWRKLMYHTIQGATHNFYRMMWWSNYLLHIFQNCGCGCLQQSTCMMGVSTRMWFQRPRPHCCDYYRDFPRLSWLPGAVVIIISWAID